MNRIFFEGLYSKCAIYVDDILVFGRDRHEHDENLRWVLERAKAFNVKMKLEKCHFAKTEVDYLGFRISGSTIRPIPNRVDTLCKSKPPKDKTQLRSLIGRLNFYARFIPDYSRQLEPLRELFRKNSDFQWQGRHQAVLESVIKSLNEAPRQLLEPNSTMKSIELHVIRDSIEVICLTDKDDLICRSSRFLTSTEYNYSATEKQLLALVLAMNKFRYWLQPDRFIIRTSDGNLEKTLKLVNRPERVDNLMLRMPPGFDCFKFETRPLLMGTISKEPEQHLPQEVHYVDGACKANGKPDCIASWAVCAEFDETLEEVGFVIEGPSNNSAELMAAIKACEIAKDRGQTEITIVTDSKYLHSAATLWIDKWLANDFQDCRRKQVVNTKLFKKLSEAKSGLKVEWIHVRGHADTAGNVRADLLARSLLENESAVLCSMSVGNKEIQPEDNEIKSLRKLIRAGKAHDFVEENECIYHIDQKAEEGDPRQVFVPQSSIPYLLDLAHDNQIYGGHLGIKKTFRKLSKFWWKGKHKDVEDYVKSCELCQMFKKQHGLPHGQLHSIPVSEVFENLHVDMIGPLATSMKGNKYIITATDAFSKWVFARPCRDITTSTVIDFMEEAIISVHGQPKNIITDRGVQFRSKEWGRFLEKTGIKHKMTASYHPQANGMDERVNGTIMRILLAYIDRFQDRWDDQIRWAVFLYNTTVHNSTGFTPYHIMFGLTPRSPLNAHGLVYSRDTKANDQIRTEIRSAAGEQIKLAQERQAGEYNKRHKRLVVQIGDLVWVKQHTCPSDMSRKMFPKYDGPFAVVGIIGDRDNPRAICVYDSGSLERKVVSLQDIKQHSERPYHLKSRDLTSSSISEGSDKTATGSRALDLIDLTSPYVGPGRIETTGDSDNAGTKDDSTINSRLSVRNAIGRDRPGDLASEVEREPIVDEEKPDEEGATPLGNPETMINDAGDDEDGNLYYSTHDLTCVEGYEPISLVSDKQPISSSPRRVTISDNVVTNYFDDPFGSDNGNPSDLGAPNDATVRNWESTDTVGDSQEDSSAVSNIAPTPERLPRYLRRSIDDPVRDPTYAPQKMTIGKYEGPMTRARSRAQATINEPQKDACRNSGPTAIEEVPEAQDEPIVPGTSEADDADISPDETLIQL